MTTERVSMEVSLSDIANGEAQHLFNHSLHEVLKNVNDINTDFSVKRKINLTFEISADEFRELLNVDILCRHSLAPRKSTKARLAMSLGRGGTPQAYEVLPKGMGKADDIVSPAIGFNALASQQG